jgi:hypothetical protein
VGRSVLLFAQLGERRQGLLVVRLRRHLGDHVRDRAVGLG